MKIADIIRLKDKSFASNKKFPYTIPETANKDKSLQMQKLTDQENRLKDEAKDIEQLYQRFLEDIREIFKRAGVDFEILPSKNNLQALIKELVDKLLLSDIDIIKIFMRYDTEEKNYIYSHSVNVTFLSVMLGIWLNYNKFDLNQLAMAALLHDIGMVKVLRLALSPRRLTPKELKEIQLHPDYSKEFVAQMPDIDEKITEGVYSHHRRLKDKRSPIGEYAQIIGLVDTLEAMTHPRVYKTATEPSSAIRKIIEESKDDFYPRIIKSLVDNLGIYPVGTWVRLDTNEIGLVIDVNSGLPLSPKVNILFDKDINRLPQPRTVDLAKQKNIHINNPLEEDLKDRLKEKLLMK